MRAGSRKGIQAEEQLSPGQEMRAPVSNSRCLQHRVVRDEAGEISTHQIITGLASPAHFVPEHFPSALKGHEYHTQTFGAFPKMLASLRRKAA